MFSPIFTVFQYYPLQTLMNFTTIFLVGFFSFRYLKRKYYNDLITKWHAAVRWLQIFYIMMLYFFTVFGRRAWDYYRYRFDVGWSYQEALVNGDMVVLKQIILNVLIFVPLGMLTAYVSKRWRLLKSLILGVSVSCSIECFQLIFRRGYFEFDDIISNTVGVTIGAVFISICYLIFLFRKRFLRKI